jgi:hypothetical protein
VSAIDRRAWLKEALETPVDSTAKLVDPIGLVGSRMDSPDPRAWSEDFRQWAITECVFRDRGFQSTSSLHVSFCDWTLRHNSVPCRRKEFEALLAMEGFLEADGLVHGLMLASDLKALKESVTQ